MKVGKYKCKFCNREMKVTYLAYMSNQYCNHCFYERADSTKNVHLNIFEFMGDKIGLSSKEVKLQ